MKALSNRIVSVIVVTYGKGNYLFSCLDSINKQTYPISETIIIDNSLNLGFREKLTQTYPYVQLYSNKENLFYCAALNLGIKVSRGEFILCLNDDVILDKAFILEALKGFDVHQWIGMVSGKVLRPDGVTIDSTGLFLSPWLTAKERGYGRKDNGQYEEEEYIFGVNGAAAFYRREMLEDIKLDVEYFAADYHIFYEDLDIAWRAQNAGWRGYYVPTAVAYHSRGATIRKGRGIGRRYAFRYLDSARQIDLLKNRYLTIIRDESYLGFLFHLPFIITYDFLIWSYILFFKPGIIAEFFCSFRYFQSIFKERKAIKEITSRR